MIRVFVAFPIPDQFAESFLQVSKNNSSLRNVRWTLKENLHVTLFFIGEIETGNLEAIKEILGKLFQNQNSFSLEFEEIALKNNKRSGMIWAAFKKNRAFTDLSENIYQAVKEFMTIERNHADPIPHCTLARVKPGADVSSIEKRVELPNNILKVDHAELWMTVQTKEGVRYESLESYSMRD